MTASLYALLSRPVIHSVLLPRNASQGRLARWSGTLTLIATTIFAAYLINLGQEGTYLGLILVWVCPFLSLLW
jgi:15-cis-phytoene synthase/lycopene beta-cyclase